MSQEQPSSNELIEELVQAVVRAWNLRYPRNSLDQIAEEFRDVLARRTAVEPSSVAPIAAIRIGEDGTGELMKLYAPGLPHGEFDLFLAPVDPQGEWNPFLSSSEPPEAAPEELTERLLAEADLCRNDGATDIAKLLEDAAKQNEVHWRTRRTLLLQLQSTAEPPVVGDQFSATCQGGSVLGDPEMYLVVHVPPDYEIALGREYVVTMTPVLTKGSEHG